MSGLSRPNDGNALLDTFTVFLKVLLEHSGLLRSKERDELRTTNVFFLSFEVANFTLSVPQHQYC